MLAKLIVEKTHLNSINQLLSGKIPQTNQQQNQSAGQNMGSQAATNSAQAGGVNVSDADMCTDILMTKKYVSGAFE